MVQDGTWMAHNGGWPPYMSNFYNLGLHGLGLELFYNANQILVHIRTTLPKSAQFFILRAFLGINC